jgi:hypothetical protein
MRAISEGSPVSAASWALTNGVDRSMRSNRLWDTGQEIATRPARTIDVDAEDRDILEMAVSDLGSDELVPLGLRERRF